MLNKCCYRFDPSMQADQRAMESERYRKSMRAVGHPSLGAAVFQDRKEGDAKPRASKNRVRKFDEANPRGEPHEAQIS